MEKADLDARYAQLAAALTRGEGRGLLDDAAALLKLEGPTERATVACAIVLVRCGKLGDARAALESFLQSNPETAPVLTNLGKVFAAQGDEDKALELGRRAVKLDASYAPGLSWWAALARVKLDDTAYRAELSALAGWRVELLLAEEAWARGDEKSAVASLERAVAAGPASVVEVAAQLETQGRHRDVVRLIAESPSLPTAARASLARAHLALGDEAHARALSVGVPGLEQQLVERTLEQQPIGVVRAVPLYAPLHLTGLEPPALSANAAQRIAFITLSEVGVSSGEPGLAAGTPEGSLCRALPLALADAFRAAGADSYTVVPVVKGKGLVSASEAWSFERALKFLPPRELPHFVVLGRLVHGLAGERQLELDLYDLQKSGAMQSLRAFGKRTDAELLQSALKQLGRAVTDAGLTLTDVPQVRASDEWLAALAAALPVFLVAAGAVDARNVWNATRGLEVCIAACLKSDDAEPRLLAASLLRAGMKADLPGFDAFEPVVRELLAMPNAPESVRRAADALRR